MPKRPKLVKCRASAGNWTKLAFLAGALLAAAGVALVLIDLWLPGTALFLFGAGSITMALLYGEVLIVDRNERRYQINRGFAFYPAIIAQGPVEELKWMAVGFRELRSHPAGSPHTTQVSTRRGGHVWFGLLAGPKGRKYVFWPANPNHPETVRREVNDLANELGIPMREEKLEQR